MVGGSCEGKIERGLKVTHDGLINIDSGVVEHIKLPNKDFDKSDQFDGNEGLSEFAKSGIGSSIYAQKRAAIK